MKETIRFFNEGSEFYTEEQCFIIELANTAEDPAVSIARARVLPGVTTSWHRLEGITERYLILEGEAVVEIGALPPQPVKPGDTAVIPPDCRQRITNTGSVDLIFLAVCTPRFRQEAYRRIEDF